MNQGIRTRAAVALNVAFALLTLVDLASWRNLLRPVESTHVSRVVWEADAQGNVDPRVVEWKYTMLPQPSAVDEQSVVIPPGYPVMVSGTPWRWRLYEERGPVLVAALGSQATRYLALDQNHEPVVQPLGRDPPPLDVLTLQRCFREDEEMDFLVHRDTITGGRCRWNGVGGTGWVVQSPVSSSRVEAEGDLVLGQRSWHGWLVVLVLLGSMIGRWAMRGGAWMATDATLVIGVFALSLHSPLWLVLWLIKNGVGAVVLVGLVLLRAWKGWRGKAAILAAGMVMGVALWTIDPVQLASLNTGFNERAAHLPSGASTSPSTQTTHLVLGYSLVNGASLSSGAYGTHATDAEIALECGMASGNVARYAMDGTNACFMVERWNQVASGLPNLRQRIHVGGFNDDLTAPVSRLGLWMGTILSVMPLAHPTPQFLKTWESGAQANLQPDRMNALLQCNNRLATGSPAPLLYVQDLATFDLGGPRRFGRVQWEGPRRSVVEEAGGRYLDMRELLVGESPVYFNDFSHLSQLGHEALARGLCRHLR